MSLFVVEHYNVIIIMKKLLVLPALTVSLLYATKFQNFVHGLIVTRVSNEKLSQLTSFFFEIF